MTEIELKQLLVNIKNQECSVDDAMTKLTALSVEDLGFAKLDHHRSVRNGFPEVIFAESKTSEQVCTIFKALLNKNNTVIATRASVEHYNAVKSEIENAVYNEMAKIIYVTDISLSDLTEKPRYIAVRDMHISTADGVSEWNFEDTEYHEQLRSYKKVTAFADNDINFSLEFLLKYLYPENWDREVKEKYLWNWSDFFRNTLEKDIVYPIEEAKNETFTGYIREYEENFSIRFPQDKRKKDFDIDVSIPTHKKVLLTR